MTHTGGKRRGREDARRRFLRHLPAMALGDMAAERIAGDASFRTYYRLRSPVSASYILMDAPPDKEKKTPAFLAVARWLKAQGFSAPEILAADTAQGFVLMEDLGDALYARILQKTGDEAAVSEWELYWQALDMLLALGKKPCDLPLPAYDTELLMAELSLFSEWFLPFALPDVSGTASAKLLDMWRRLLDAFTAEASALSCMVLRDCHAENLLWLPERGGGVASVGLLDFQDAVIGSPAYDLVSLLEDARRDVSPELVAQAMEYYLTRHLPGDAPGQDAFRRHYAMLGAQRNLKIIGIFCRLARRDRKPHYLSFLPRVWGHLAHDLCHPALAEVAAWMERHVPPSARGVPAR